MQFLKIARNTLIKPLSTVVGIIDKRHSLPILTNVLIRKNGNRIFLIATDLEIQILVHTDITEDNLNDIAITVSARKLLDILKSLPDKDMIKMELTDHKLLVRFGRSRFVLQAIVANDFPVLSLPKSWDISLILSEGNLRCLLGMVYFAMAQHDVRYYLNGILLRFESLCIRAVATDGHRLAHFSIKSNIFKNSKSEIRDIIISRKAVLELYKLLDNSDTIVSIDVSKNRIRFQFRDIEFISKLIDGKYPDFVRVIPNDYTRHFIIPHNLIRNVLQRMSILTTDQFKGVRLQLTKNLIRISCINNEQEEAQEEIDIDYNYEPLDIGFNIAYLLDFLTNIKTDIIRLSIMPNKNASVLISLPDKEQFKYVVMPMNI